MNLNNIDIVLAERTNPQAVNLGFVTARRYFWPLFLAGSFAMLPLLLIALLIAHFYEGFFWASLLLWWAKPYVDRVILLNASRLLFRERIGLTDIINSLGQALKNGLWLNLTFYRFSLQRCLNLPVMVLEELTGRDYSQRTKIIGRGSSSPASATTIGLLHVDWVLYLNVFLLIIMFLPDSAMQQISDSINYLNIIRGHDGLAGLEWLLWVLLPIQALCSVVVEIFYVMVGFMLYLNSRVRSEGWHIELAFKQMAQRLSGLTRTALSAMLIITASILVTLPATADASTNDNAPTVNLTPTEDKAILKEILLDDENNPYRVKGQWKPKKQRKSQPKDRRESRFGDFPNLAPLIKILLIIGGLVLVFWLIANRERFAGLWQRQAKIIDDERPSVMFGLDIRRESLPDDIAGEAARLLAQGDGLAALSMLYRGSLAALVDHHNIDIKESDTEGDCLARSQRKTSATTYRYFKSLTQAWQSTVYAHRTPSAPQIESLIQQWRSAFAHSPYHTAEVSA